MTCPSHFIEDALTEPHTNGRYQELDVIKYHTNSSWYKSKVSDVTSVDVSSRKWACLPGSGRVLCLPRKEGRPVSCIHASSGHVSSFMVTVNGFYCGHVSTWKRNWFSVIISTLRLERFGVVASRFHSPCSPVLCVFSLYSCPLQVCLNNVSPPQFRSSYLSVSNHFHLLITSSYFASLIKKSTFSKYSFGREGGLKKE